MYFYFVYGQSLFSVLRPCDAVEHLYLSSIGSCIPEDMANVPFVTDGKSRCAIHVPVMVRYEICS